MKKILCSVLVWVMVLGCVGVYADTEVLFNAMDKTVLSADVHTELGVKLNKPFEFISQLISEEDMNKLKELANETLNPKEILVTDVGSCIGAHAGPGVMGIFCIK